MSQRRFRNMAVSIFFVVAFICGCTAPTTVKKYAAVSKKASEQFLGIQKDLYGSCVRQQFYRGLSTSEPALDTLGTAGGSACKEYKQGATGLRQANRVLVDYLKTLSKLADNKLVAYEDDFDGFTDALGDTYPFDKRRVAAVEGVSSFLVEVAAGGWRRSELGNAIEKTNDDIQVLAAMLDDVVSNDYIQLLDSEREATRKYFLGKLKVGGEEEPLAAVLVYDLWQRELATLDSKQDAARTCGRILRKVAKGHQRLYDNRDDLDSKEMKKFVLEYTETIEDLIHDVDTAF